MTMDVSIRRERTVQVLAVPIAALLFFSFFLPRGLSSTWQFGWDNDTFKMVIEILQVMAGLCLASVIILPLPKFLKAVVLLALGVFLTAVVLFDSVRPFSAFFSNPIWMDQGAWILLPAFAMTFAIHSESDRDNSGRAAFGVVGGAVMLLLAFLPITFQRVGITPMTAFIETWSNFPGSVDFGEFLFLATWIVVISLGPAMGGLFMAHSALSIVRPEKRLQGAGSVAGAVFLLWHPAVWMVFWVFLWSGSKVVFTTVFVALAPSLGCAFLLAAGVYYLGEAFAAEPDRAASLSPGFGAMVVGEALEPEEAPYSGYEENDESGVASEGYDYEPGGAQQDEDQVASDGVAQGEEDELSPSAMWSVAEPEEPLPPFSSPVDQLPFAATVAGESTQAVAIGNMESILSADEERGKELDRHWTAGAAAWQRQDWDEALEHYNAVIRLDPSATDARKAVGDIHYGLGNLNEAETYYQQVLAERPNDEYTQRALEQIKLYRG